MLPHFARCGSLSLCASPIAACRPATHRAMPRLADRGTGPEPDNGAILFDRHPTHVEHLHWLGRGADFKGQAGIIVEPQLAIDMAKDRAELADLHESLSALGRHIFDLQDRLLPCIGI